MTDTFPAFEDLVPHAEPMVLLDSMVRWEPGEAECALHLREDAPFVADGAVDCLICIEYMAQAVAACLGYEAFRGGDGVRVGMIIACKSFDLHAPSIAVGSDVRVRVKRVRGNEMLSHFNGEVEVDAEVVSSATMTLFHAEKPPE